MTAGGVRKPNKLNPEVVKRLVEMYRVGATLTDAARYAAIARQTLYNWIADGREQLAYFADQPEGSYDLPDEAALVILLDGATAEFAKEQLANITIHSKREWQASAWLLERRLPDEWGKRDRVDHTHTIILQAEELARARGLDAEATARLVDFAKARAQRRAG